MLQDSSGADPAQPATSAWLDSSALKESAEYSDFAQSDFDPDAYANRIIQAPEGKSFHRSDIASALSRLSFSLDHLNKQLHQQVAAHHEDLLEQVTGLDGLELALDSIKENLYSLNSSFNRVKSKIRDTYTQINTQTNELQLMQEGTEILRNVQRFLSLIQRLEMHMDEQPVGGAGLAKAATCVKEIETLMHECDLTGIDIIDPEIPKIGVAKDKILAMGDKQLLDGLHSQNQAEIASGLQVFYNIGLIASKSKSVIDSMLDVISKETQTALSVQTLSKEIKDQHALTDKGKKGVEVVNISGPLYTSQLWKRLEALMDIIYEKTAKMYLLERVLSRKRDPLSQTAYLDHVAEGMDGNLVRYYWKAVSITFEKEIRSAVKSSSFFHQIFQIGYPKLLRLFHDLFIRLNVTTAFSSPTGGPTTGKPGSSNVAGSGSNASAKQGAFSPLSPTGEDGSVAGKYASEPTVLLKALASFEAAYLRESLARLLEPVNQAFPEKLATSSRAGSTRDDVEKLLRAISRELEISKFDSNLLKAVTKNASKAINMYAIRSEHLVATDSSVYVIPGTPSCTPSQLLNIEIINCLWTLAEGVWKIVDEFEDDHVVVLLNDSVEAVQKLIQSVAESLIAGITRDLELAIVKMHKEDFNNRLVSKGSASAGANGADQSLSQYVVELGSKLRWVQREIMARLNCGEDVKEWYKAVGTRVIDFFLRHASIIRPLNTEQGKLKLTTDMTQLEFALNQWIQPTSLKLEAAMGQSYKALRSFRQLLFLDLSQVGGVHHTADIPKVVVAHHLIVRAHPLIHLPVTAFGWNELQYSDWLDVHSEGEAVALLIQCLEMYMEDVRKKGGREYRVEFVAVRNFLTL
ncbi:Golgi transport complex subunit 5-domain-containing protein [Chytriomyces cf. hyalinus JEL632]|nr:Golgi transport complex subunit 5-domain-containing protein [Chytriomyces cf. hyalinus JEL632]